MRRRDFITLLGGATGAWPLVARAQQPGKLPTIGFLGGEHAFGFRPMGCRLRAATRRAWVDRGAHGRINIAGRKDAASTSPRSRPSWSSSRLNVIVTTGGAVLAAKQATRVIPIVFVVAADPVLLRAWSRAWPGRAAMSPACRSNPPTLAGNVIELLREVVPGLRVGDPHGHRL